MDFTLNEYSAPRTIEKVKILGAVLELSAKQHCQFGLFAEKWGKMFKKIWISELGNRHKDFDFGY